MPGIEHTKNSTRGANADLWDLNLLFLAALQIPVGFYPIISGVLVIVDEYIGSQKVKGTNSS